MNVFVFVTDTDNARKVEQAILFSFERKMEQKMSNGPYGWCMKDKHRDIGVKETL